MQARTLIGVGVRLAPLDCSCCISLATLGTLGVELEFTIRVFFEDNGAFLAEPEGLGVEDEFSLFLADLGDFEGVCRKVVVKYMTVYRKIRHNVHVTPIAREALLFHLL